jgi:hypothetical protein
VFPRESRNPRSERRARRQTALTALEGLEERTLLSFSTLGFSLPDLTVSGQAGPRAAWGGTLDVSVMLQNIGASTTTEPVSQLPPTEPQAAGSLYNSTSSADAPASTIAVLLTKSPNSLAGAITLGTIAAGPVTQNNMEQLSAPFTLPSRPRGFPGAGGTFFVHFVANSTDAFEEANFANNVSPPVAVKVTRQPLPELRVIGLSVPSNLQPDDTIEPIITIENFGTAGSGPVTVELVSSVTPSFTLGSQIVTTYEVPNIPGVSQTPTGGNFNTFATQILSPPTNVFTIDGAAVTLPTSPRTFFLGVVVDPDHDVNMLSRPKNALQAIRVVGPPRRVLSASGPISAPNTGQFPSAPTGETVGIS